ncbi:MAG: hypothetical protein IME99_05995, partial [Proteobacteria bacterium]|nr:hypothetical protein [Pseudomonadota bacterium]
MSSKKATFAEQKLTTTRRAFIAGFWPVLLVYAVGPIGDVIMGREMVTEPLYPVMITVSLLITVTIFVVAGLWAYRPLARLVIGTLSTDTASVEAAVSRLPYRVGAAFLLAGILIASVDVALIALPSTNLAGQLPPRLILGVSLMNYYGYGLVITVLGVSSTINFTTRLRKALSRQGIFTGNLHSTTFTSSIISVTKRPWQLFIIVSVLPLLLIGLLYMIANGLDDQTHLQVAHTVMLQMFIGVLICGTYLVYTMRNTMKLAIDEIGSGMDSIQRGEYSRRVAVLLDDETGNMARSLNTALAGLQEREDMKSALSLAAEIQSGLLPKEPPVPSGFTLETFQQSCYDVGGDYYDVIELSDGRMWYVVADVSGKGYSAALIVANLHAIL